MSKIVMVLGFTYSYKKLRYIFFSYAPNNFLNISPFSPASDLFELILVAYGCPHINNSLLGNPVSTNGISAGDSDFPFGRLKKRSKNISRVPNRE